MSKLKFKQESNRLWQAESPNGLFTFEVFRLFDRKYKTLVSRREGEATHYVVKNVFETLEEAQNAALGMLAEWLTSAVDEMVLMEDV